MKILLVHNSYQQHGGEDTVVEQERQLLERAGHGVAVYQRSNHEIQDCSAVGRLQLPGRAVWATDSRRQIAELISRHRPDVIHVHNTFVVVSPSIYSACQEAQIPVVQTLHNYRLLCPAATFFRNGKVCEECVDHSLWRGIRYGCYRDSRLETATVALMLAIHRHRGTWTQDVNCYIALTEFVRRKFVDGGLPEDKIFVKPNFVHPDPGADQEDHGRAGYALFVGRLSPEKGVRTLLAAWQRLHSRIPLLIVGDGPQRAELEAQAEHLGLSGVQFRGFLPRAQTLAAIKGASFLVFPSGWYEHFPVTIAEAFACSTPIICSGLGAMQEIVEDRHTGLHFTPGDADDLAVKVEWAWNHPEQVWAMGKEARREYEVKYTADQNYQILMRIYRRAIATHPPAAQPAQVPFPISA
ncbi:MAG: glycosyl transferase family 1 [Acidobacteria bacterium]|nr:MAG: glycosyl transferase family 1 [Acidobacteriota bacterium]